MDLITQLSDKFNSLGYSTLINRSRTMFGNSDYLYVAIKEENECFINKDYSCKIRISDHDVSNIDRVFNEVHINALREFNNDDFERILKEVRFKLEREKFFKKQDNFEIEEYIVDDVREPYERDVIISDRLTKKGAIVYKVRRTKRVPVIEYVDVESGKVFRKYYN